jgi:hypothetical protein
MDWSWWPAELASSIVFLVITTIMAYERKVNREENYIIEFWMLKYTCMTVIFVVRFTSYWISNIHSTVTVENRTDVHMAYLGGNYCRIRCPGTLYRARIKHYVKSSPATCPGGAWGERKYSSYSITTSALDGVSGHHAPAALYPGGKDSRYPLYRRLGGPQSRSGPRG